MKKLLLVLAIGAFVACNDNASSTSTSDSTTAAGDSMGASVDTGMSKMTDTSSMSKMADTSSMSKMDTTKKK